MKSGSPVFDRLMAELEQPMREQLYICIFGRQYPRWERLRNYLETSLLPRRPR